MIRILKYITLAGVMALAWGCGKDQAHSPYAGRPVVLSVSAEGFEGEDNTRSKAEFALEEYFGLVSPGGTDYSKVTLTAGPEITTYKYVSGDLTAATENDIVRFPVNGNLSGLSILWPQNADTGAGAAPDQSTKEGFLSNDLLGFEITNVVPAVKIPVVFSHMRAKIVFRLTGALAGNKITSLTMANGYKAFCYPDNPAETDAHMILNPGSAGDRSLLTQGLKGIVSVEGVGNRGFNLTIVLVTLSGGNSYVIELNL